MEIFIFLACAAGFCLVGCLFAIKVINPKASKTETVLGTLYIISVLVFLAGMYFHSNPHTLAIDPVDMECYSPIGEDSSLTFFFYQLMFNIAIIIMWRKGNQQPPLLIVILACFLVYGIVLNIALAYQVSGHNRESIGEYTNDGTLFFIFAPLLSIVIAILFLVRIIKQNAFDADEISHQNRILDRINKLMVRANSLSFTIILLLLPLFLVCTLLLMLFGQEPYAVANIFTDTTLWRLSQQSHPPVLDHKGHYLCTVAAKGSPALVKPIAIGRRGNRDIIVNRQLQIANAFEEVIQIKWPFLHRFIRTNYDQYGYNLSAKINSEVWSNITYVLMKPVEYIFLCVLYISCEKPEELIRKQYLFKTKE